MYESPITIIEDEIKMEFEDNIAKAVENVGVLVNRDELVKALQYDRDQYNKGYTDCRIEMIEKVKSMKIDTENDSFNYAPESIQEMLLKMNEHYDDVIEMLEGEYVS